ncbi:MAG: response regulator [Planctomycetales bacterium]|nr:response regulator [Planctomycetales bacterium]
MSDPIHVLVVESDNDVAHSTCIRLCQAGLHAVAVPNLHQAIDEACQKTPDVILFDVACPYANGGQIVETLRTFEPTREIPVILTSATRARRCKVVSQSPVTWLPRPFAGHELVDAIRNTVGASRPTATSSCARTDGGHSVVRKSSSPAPASRLRRSALHFLTET